MTRDPSEQISAACTQQPIAAPAVNGAGHPRLQFYEPGQKPPPDQFRHVMGDSYVIATYRPDIPAADLARLRSQVKDQPKQAIGGPDRDQAAPLIATTARTRLTCTKVDDAAYVKYRDAWLKQVFPTTS